MWRQSNALGPRGAIYVNWFIIRSVSYWSPTRCQTFTHYGDVIMGTMTSHITSLTIVFSTVYPGADKRKHQSSASLAFVQEFTGDRFFSQKASNAGFDVLFKVSQNKLLKNRCRWSKTQWRSCDVTVMREHDMRPKARALLWNIRDIIKK